VVKALKADAAIVKNAIEITARSRRNWRINRSEMLRKALCFKEYF